MTGKTPRTTDDFTTLDGFLEAEGVREEFQAVATSELEDYRLAAEVLERVRKGEEPVHPLDEIERELGLGD
jgi:RHH-type rel operon transcriptional repressor/antitoxin RelB